MLPLRRGFELFPFVSTNHICFPKSFDSPFDCVLLSNNVIKLISSCCSILGMMQEALIVNPYELEDVADKLHRALQMPFDERLLRMKQLQRREKAMDVNNWLNEFLRAMGLLPCDLNANPSNTKMAPLSMDDFDYYLSDYVDVDENDKSKLSLILDYDGTLAPLAQKPELALMPEETRNVLKRLVRYSQDVSICIISGRSLTNLREVINIPGITYAGAHGLEILSPDGTKYVHPITSEHESRITDLLKALQNEVCKEGAWVENKGALLTFHYREVPRQLRDAFISRATEIFVEHGFLAHKAPMALEAKPEVKWDRGRASIHILRTTYGVDWTDRVRVIYCGDDNSDEEAIQALSGIACTFKVSSAGSSRTAANYRLRSYEEVLLMLQWIEKKLSLRRSPSPTSPTRPSSISMSFSFDEQSDDEIRRIRTNSRGRTQNIFRRARKSTLCDSVDLESERKSGETSPESPPSPPVEIVDGFNRYL
jgi:trehalose 6-phosphate synthase/phosphatase